MNKKQISLVIGSYNRLNLLVLCIEAVREELKDFKYEIIVVDGGSNDGSTEWLLQQKDIITIVQHNRGEWQGKPIERRSWGYFMNLGFKAAQGKYICMLSDDSLIIPGAIKNGYKLFEENLAKGRKIGGVAFYFRDYPVRKKYAVAVNVGNLYVNHGLYLNEALKEVDYISEDEYHFYFADTDLVLKMKQKGYEIVASKKSFVEHYFEATPEIRASNNDEKKLIDRNHLIEKWCDIAYPKREKRNYQKHIGYWKEIDYNDKTRTIDKLMSSGKVTIITVTFNAANDLKKTIDNIRSQTYKNIEYIIIDGGSSDHSIDIIKNNLDIISYYKSEADSGIYNAMNKGLERATGQWINFMNAGDEFVDNRTIETVMKYITDSNIDALYGNRIYIDKNANRIQQKAQPIHTVYQKMPFGHQSLFLKTKILQQYKFNECYKSAADYDLILRLFQNNIKFLYIDYDICNFYAGGMSESGFLPYIEVLKAILDNNPSKLKNNFYFKKFIEKFDSLIEEVEK